MPLSSFVEILLDVDISPQPRGGPEHDNLITTTPVGVEQVNINRYDYISRYMIDYGLLEPPLRKYLRSFHILRQGSAQGFRMLPPDDFEIENELVGSVASGTFNYFLKKTYQDIGNTIVRRIVKPAWDDIEIAVGDTIIPIQPQSGVGGVPEYGVGLYGGFGAEELSVNFTTGVVTVSSAFATAFNGQEMRWSGTYHLPVRFENDWNEMRHDIAGDWGSVGIREILPIGLGITE